MSGSGTGLMDCRVAFTEACLGPAFQNKDVSNLIHLPVPQTGLCSPVLYQRRPPCPLPPEGLCPSCVLPSVTSFLCTWPWLWLGKPRAAWWPGTGPARLPGDPGRPWRGVGGRVHRVLWAGWLCSPQGRPGHLQSACVVHGHGLCLLLLGPARSCRRGIC